jgi:hypothetical protein
METLTVKTLWQDIKTALDALAHADLGELKPQEQKAELLNALPPATALQQKMAGRRVARSRQVVLAIEGRLPPAAMQYAVNTCQRVDADLDLLCTVSQAVAEKAIVPYVDMLRAADIAWRIAVRNGPLPQAITNYTRTQPGTLLVVAGADTELHARTAQGGPSRSAAWRLDFPLVVVGDNR